MIQMKLMLCADGIVIDRLTNNASVFSIIEEITPAALPFAMLRFCVLAVLERDATDPPRIESSVRIAINERNIIEQTVVIDFEDKLRNRTVVTAVAMPIPDSGTLQASLWYAGQRLGQYDIKVNLPPTPRVETTSA